MNNHKRSSRHSLRLKNYDYSSAGAYFVTIVVHHRRPLLGEIANDEFLPNPAGVEIARIWMDLSSRFSSIELDEFCVMPNHFHGIVMINSPLDNSIAISGDHVGAALVAARSAIDPDPGRAETSPAPTRQPALGKIIGAFKSLSTNAYIHGVRTREWQPFEKTLWQRNYYEHIIRNEDELNRIRQYIIDNPIKWFLDQENPVNSTDNANDYS